jgi:sterol desaturase/sphingolipid hydroxylase (fatty acid hydroxylase superfamily)
MATLGTWICLKTFRAAMFHAGYEFPWSLMSVIPFGGHEEFHSFHHSQNMGNYATWLLVWDRVFGTDKVYYESKKNGSYGRIKSQ